MTKIEFKPAAGIRDHGSLLGLTDDDHSQYALLAGRSGGQTLAGSTDTGESLVLKDNTTDNRTLTIAGTTVLTTDFHLDDGSGNSPNFVLKDGDDETLTLSKNDGGTASVINSEGAIYIRPSGDADDWFSFTVASNVPTLHAHNAAAGSCNLKITASGGTIDFDDENLTTTGTLTAAGASLSGDLDMADDDKILLGTGDDGEFYVSSDDLYIKNVTQDKDIYINANVGGSDTTMVFIDGSAGDLSVGGTLTGYGRFSVQENVAGNMQMSLVNPSTDGSSAITLALYQGGLNRAQLQYLRSSMKTTLIAGNSVALGLGAGNAEIITIASTGGITIADAKDITFNTSTGTKLGTATNEKLAFYGSTPIVQPSAYTVSNGSTDRSYDADATTIHELADVLGTLVGDLQSLGLIG